MASSKADFLGNLPLFANLYLDELEDLALLAREYEYPARSVVAYQRDVADRMYVVRSGRLEAYALDDAGNLAWERQYLTGDAFEDKWLFTPHAFPATIKTAEPSRLIIIHGPEFLSFLEKHPGALDRLYPEDTDETAPGAGLSEEAWEEAAQSRVAVPRSQFRAARLLPDELIVFEARRSVYYLLLRILVPALLLVGLSGALLYGLLPAVNVTLGVEIGLAVAAGIILALVAFRYLDWRNDYFLITTKHLIHHEFSLRTFQTAVNKTPIDQVQSVEIEKPTLLSNLLGVGTARVTTASQQGAIYFDFIDDPGAVSATLTELRERVRSLDAGRVQASMRRSLEQHFNIEDPASPVVEEEEAVWVPPTQSPGLLDRLRSFFGYRVEEGSRITYRKHMFIMVYQVRWPLGVALLLTLLFVLLRVNWIRVGAGVAFLVNLGWLIWQFEDWRNDTFQVDDRYVIDIDRRPFGFAESRKQAQLDNIQNISASRPNFAATLFNFGNVIIETAGATADIVFESVVDPNQVQSDIFDRRERFKQRQRMREGEQRRKEYAVLLDVYKQAIEQERIPNRTRPGS